MEVLNKIFSPKAPQKIVESLIENRKALAVVAIGIGNVAVAGKVIQQFLKGKGAYRILYLCDNNSFLKEAINELSLIFETESIQVARMFGKHDQVSKSMKSITFASFQKMIGNSDWKKSFRLDYFDIVIVDRAHTAPSKNNISIVDYFKERNVPLFGITTVPDATDDKKLVALFGRPTVNVSLEELIAMGSLNEFTYTIMNDNLNKQKLIDIFDYEKTEGRRPSMKSLNETLFIEKRDSVIADEIFEETKHLRKNIIFCENKKHANLFQRLLAEKAVTFAYESDLSSKSKAMVIDKFLNQNAKYLIVIDMVHERFELPEIDSITFLRATSSKRVFYSQLSAGLRRTRTKKNILIFDFVANVDRLMAINSTMSQLKKAEESLEAKMNGENIDSNDEVSVIDNLGENDIFDLKDIVTNVADVDEVEKLKSSSRKFKRSREIIFNGNHFEFVFNVDVMSAIDVAQKIRLGYYPTREEAKSASLVLGFKTKDEYKKGYKKDLRLHKSPDIYYPGFIHWDEFLETPLAPFYRLPDDKKIESIIKAFANNGIDSFGKMVNISPFVLQQIDFGIFGNGINFAGIILDSIVTQLTPPILNEIAEKIGWKELNSSKSFKMEC